MDDAGHTPRTRLVATPFLPAQHFWRILWLLLAGLLAPQTSSAQLFDSPRGPQPWQLERLPPVEAEPALRVEEVERLALANNPTIGRAIADVEAARGAWVQGGKWRNPVVGVGQQQTGSEGRAEQDGVTFSQEFVLGGKLRLNQAVAAAEIGRAQQNLATQQLRVITDARIAFYSALFAQRQQALAQSLVKIAEEGVADARRRDKAAAVGRNDVLEAEIELFNAQIQARKSVHRQAAAWRSLGAVVGLGSLPPRELEDDLPQVMEEYDWSGTLQRILQTSPEIGAAVANVETKKNSLRRASVEKIPNVTFDGLVNWRDNGIGGDPDGGFLVSMPLPVWDRNQGEIVQRRGEVASAQRTLQQLEFDIQNRLAGVFERYDNARYQVRHYREFILPSAAEALELTRKNYQAGQVDYDDLLTSQRTNAQVNLDYLDSLRELWVATAELSGMLLTGSLENSPD